ncbi:unnamed protein product [Sphenostylis stenocarpa]|uniref:Uncharacterized protein n=1 Tax=Sphenostylis stenocarpa TaxID=92480 RepID=A0AA86V293_9FABA|nr:unnamed protein product [Sphenostylis stenocarpa]
MDDITDYASSFGWVVDSAIRSDTGSNLGASPAPEVVLLHFALVEDNGMMRSNTGGGADLEASSVRGFASAVDVRSAAESNVMEYDVEGKRDGNVNNC